MAMTADEYFARNQANAAASPLPMTRPKMDEFRANNRERYGYDGTYADGLRYDAERAKRDIWKKAILPAAIFTTGGAALGGAGLPSAATAGVEFSAAPSAAGVGGMTFGNLLKLGELGVGLTTNLIGNRQNNRALERDASMRQNEFGQQMAMLQQQNAMARQQWEADQAQRAQEYAALQQDRALQQQDRQRRIAEEDRLRALDEAREQRRAPYRQMSADALLRMRDLLRLGGGR